MTDQETQVELRHFALEKYIESKTPPLSFNLDSSGLKVPERFTSHRLIYDGGVAGQYGKSSATVHLASLHYAREGVNELSGFSQKITDEIVNFYAKYYKLQLEEFSKIATGQHAVEAAKIALRAAEEAFAIENKLLDEARNALDDAQRIIETYPDLIFGLGAQISENLKAISEAAGAIQKLSKAKQDAIDAVNDARNKLSGLVCGVTKQVCHDVTERVCDWDPTGAICKWVGRQVCGLVDASDPLCGPTKALVDGAISTLNDVTSRLEQAIAQEVELRAKDAALAAEKLEKETKLAAARAGLDALRAVVSAHQAALDVKKQIVVEAKNAVAEAERKLEEIRKSAEPILKIVDEIAQIAKECNSLSLFMKNWRDGIERAGDDFISASLSVGFSIMKEDGNAIEHYQRWLQCSALNYLGVPWQLPFAYCEVKDKVEEITAKIEELKEKLPPILRWLLDPLGELKKEAIKVAKKEVWEAAKDAADFVMRPPTGRFIGMLAGQEKATAEALRDIFSKNESPKKLLVFPDVVAMVNSDIGLQSGVFNSQAFHAMRNAVALAKLSLLSAEELNRLHADLSDGLPTRYGPELYGDQVGKRFSILYFAIRSIDGNHQWQPFGLPYLRSDRKHAPADPRLRRYGYSAHDNRYDGFRLFQDGVARERIFLQLFTGPVDGSMAKIPEAQWNGYNNGYNYPACELNPFPRTVDDLGNHMSSDPACVGKEPTVAGKAPRAPTTAYGIADGRAGRGRRLSRTAVVACVRDVADTKGRRPIVLRISVAASANVLPRNVTQCRWGSSNIAGTAASGWWEAKSKVVGGEKIRRREMAKR